jgi:UDP-2,3-diacylglucosamine pyrophosphatase LpxH
MLTSNHGIDALAEALEVRFLANRDPHLHFALLTDFTDADAMQVAADEALLAAAVVAIDANCLLAKPTEKLCSIGNFGTRITEHLAHFKRDGSSKFFLFGNHDVKCLAQYLCAHAWRSVLPRHKCIVGHVYRVQAICD